MLRPAALMSVAAPWRIDPGFTRLWSRSGQYFTTALLRCSAKPLYVSPQKTSVSPSASTRRISRANHVAGLNVPLPSFGGSVTMNLSCLTFAVLVNCW